MFMKKEQNNLEKLKEENPFKVPEGYFENLTTQIMSQLPEQPDIKEPAKSVTMMERVRPWLYMAAVFAGLLLFFRALTGISPTGEETDQDSLLVHTEALPHDFYTEDEEYLEYIENQYASYLLTEEWDYSE